MMIHVCNSSALMPVLIKTLSVQYLTCHCCVLGIERLNDFILFSCSFFSCVTLVSFTRWNGNTKHALTVLIVCLNIDLQFVRPSKGCVVCLCRSFIFAFLQWHRFVEFLYIDFVFIILYNSNSNIYVYNDFIALPIPVIAQYCVRFFFALSFHV